MKTVAEKLRDYVAIDPVTGCHIWQRHVAPNGYGQICTPGRIRRIAHRAAYEVAKGPIPDGLQIDHLCKNTRCVNPDHLEAVTQRVNALRSNSPAALNAQKTHCPRSHPYAAGNMRQRPNGSRVCLTCDRDSARRRYWERRA